MRATARYRCSYNFDWLGRPIIQLPQDIVAMQELIWRVKPDLVVETGVARGGSAVLYASVLKLIGGEGIVVAVDIDIRAHNRAAIEAHPLADRIKLVQGSDRKSTRLNSSHQIISYAVFCLKKKKTHNSQASTHPLSNPHHLRHHPLPPPST